MLPTWTNIGDFATLGESHSSVPLNSPELANAIETCGSWKEVVARAYVSLQKPGPLPIPFFPPRAARIAALAALAALAYLCAFATLGNFSAYPAPFAGPNLVARDAAACAALAARSSCLFATRAAANSHPASSSAVWHPPNHRFKDLRPQSPAVQRKGYKPPPHCTTVQEALPSAEHSALPKEM